MKTYCKPMALVIRLNYRDVITTSFGDGVIQDGDDWNFSI